MGCTESRTKDSLDGRKTINMVWKVPKDKVAEIDAMWKDHEAFMRKTHAMGAGDTESPGLFEFWITKGEELKDPMDESKGKTGNTLYTMHEIYVDEEGIDKHLELFKAWKGEDEKSEEGKKMEALLEANKTYGVFTQIGSATVSKKMEDKYNSSVVGKTGDVTVHCVWMVPKGEEESEADAFWAEHEAFMRGTHAFGREGGDKPSLTHYTILKGAELKNPMDAKEGETGNIMYIMAESYAAKEDVKKHLDAANAWAGANGEGEKGKFMEQFQKMSAKYGKHMDLGSAIMTNMND